MSQGGSGNNDRSALGRLGMHINICCGSDSTTSASSSINVTNATIAGGGGRAADAALLFIFDFDCTITSRHFWGLMNGDLSSSPRDSKVKAVDLEEAKFLRRSAVKGYGRESASIDDGISEEVKSRLVSYIFGGEARLSWLRSFLADLKKLGRNVQVELWTRSYGNQVHSLISKEYVDLIGCFDKIVDRSCFKKKKSDYLDRSIKASYSRIFIFEDTADEFTYHFRMSDLFHSFENIHMYNKLEKDGSGIPVDPRILEAIDTISNYR
jgi:hypothetical protein